jgi:hypothetical protein
MRQEEGEGEAGFATVEVPGQNQALVVVDGCLSCCPKEQEEQPSGRGACLLHQDKSGDLTAARLVRWEERVPLLEAVVEGPGWPIMAD